MVVIIFLAILAIFLILSRRKLGLFSLAIFAGISLNRFWNTEATNFLVELSLNIPRETLSGIVGLVLILAPAFLVLPKGGKQEKWTIGIISSLAAAIFSVSVSISSFRTIFILDDFSKNIASLVESNFSNIILAGVFFSILGVLSFKIKKPDENS